MDLLTRIGLFIYTAIMFIVGIAMLSSAGVGPNRLFWKSFGVTLIILAGPLFYIAIEGVTM